MITLSLTEINDLRSAAAQLELLLGHVASENPGRLWRASPQQCEKIHHHASALLAAIESVLAEQSHAALIESPPCPVRGLLFPEAIDP